MLKKAKIALGIIALIVAAGFGCADEKLIGGLLALAGIALLAIPVKGDAHNTSVDPGTNATGDLTDWRAGGGDTSHESSSNGQGRSTTEPRQGATNW